MLGVCARRFLFNAARKWPPKKKKIRTTNKAAAILSGPIAPDRWLSSRLCCVETRFEFDTDASAADTLQLLVPFPNLCLPLSLPRTHTTHLLAQQAGTDETPTPPATRPPPPAGIGKRPLAPSYLLHPGKRPDAWSPPLARRVLT